MSPEAVNSHVTSEVMGDHVEVDDFPVVGLLELVLADRLGFLAHQSQRLVSGLQHRARAILQQYCCVVGESGRLDGISLHAPQ